MLAIRGFVVVVAFAGATVGGSGSAEASAGPASRPFASSLPVQPTIGGEDDVSDRDRPAVANKLVASMKEMMNHLLVMLDEARKSKDVVKLNCLNEKLTQTKGLLRISEQAEIAMQESLLRRDEEQGRHEFAKISISHLRVQGLKAEAESCVGELATYSGSTIVQVEGENQLSQDPTYLPPPTIPIERPPQVSPYQ